MTLKDYHLAIWSIFTSMLYCYLIKTITIGDEVFIFYSLGSGIGVMFSRKIADKIIKQIRNGIDEKTRENS